MEVSLDSPTVLEPQRSARRAAAMISGAAVIVTVSAISGAALADGDRAGVVIPLGVASGLGLALIAFTRFELFLMIVIAMRAALDAAKLTTTSVDATGALSVLFIGASAVWLYRHRGTMRDASPVRELLVPFTAFLGAAVLSIAFSSHPFDSALEAVRIGTIIVVIIVLARLIRDWAGIRVLLLAVFGSALLPLAAAALEVARGQAGITATGIGRVEGTFLHPNPFAAYLGLILILGVALLPHVSRRWRWVLGTLVLACGGILVSTYARGAWLAALIALLVVALLQARWILWLVAVAIVLLALAVPSVGLRLADLSETRSASGAPANSLAWRIEYWDQALALQDNPILGIGLREVELSEEGAKAPHNDLVRVYVEMGIVGLAAYLWLIATLFRHAVSTYRTAADGVAKGLAVAFLATLTGLVVLSIAANVISQLVILWYFAAIVVLASVASRLPSQPEPSG